MFERLLLSSTALSRFSQAVDWSRVGNHAGSRVNKIQGDWDSGRELQIYRQRWLQKPMQFLRWLA
jgi:hypothetical protein